MPLKILVVDDNRPTRQLIGNYLSALGHTYEEAEDGREAITHLQKSPVDGIFLDLLMPRLDGFEVLNWLFHNGIEIPAIVFTEASQRLNADYASMTERFGAIKAYDKPITRPILEEALEIVRTYRGRELSA